MLFILKIIFGFIVQVNKPKFSPMYFDGMIYIKLYARFVPPPPFIQIMLKTSSKAILVN